ncbi:Uncharacterized protein APZ42_020943 [Daphnia magna]|uniref:Uncharacterized protein n=1 Tax=Daphnia magna TaxID=35525 RepID=A0A164X3R6_9CRUS|nr:Uncharacterized protein APZ42_020943 [Daphnia magna]
MRERFVKFKNSGSSFFVIYPICYNFFRIISFIHFYGYKTLSEIHSHLSR